MIAITGDRNILVRLLAGRLSVAADGRHYASLGSLPPAELSAVYFREGTAQVAPDLLVVDTPHLQEFFAWCRTYVPHWSPLSAGIHVLERRKLRDVGEAPRVAIPRQILRGLLCASLGELLIEWRLTNVHSAPSVLSLRSTFGYVATSAILANHGCHNDLLSRWGRAQHLLQVTPRRVSEKTLKRVWEPLFALAVRDPDDFGHAKAIGDELSRLVGRRSQRLRQELQPPSSTPQRHEDIIVELDGFIRDATLSEAGDCLEAAMRAQSMSSRPLSHFDVLAEMAHAEPRTLLWYSFLSGAGAVDPASPLVENLLFRVESDLRGSPRVRPDITLDELEVFIDPDGRVPQGVGIGAPFINVELDVGVCASFRVQREAAAPNRRALDEDDRQRFEYLVDELRRVFQRNEAPSDSDSREQRSTKRRRRRKS